MQSNSVSEGSKAFDPNIMCLKSVQIPFFPAIPSRKAASQGILIPRLFRYDSPSQIQIRMQIRTFRQKFLLPLSADLLPARSVPVFYGIQYNCCRLSLFTSSENQVSQQTPPHYITSLFNIQPTILPEYVLFFIVFSQNTCFFPLLLCALTKDPSRARKPKKVYNFSSRCYAVRKWSRKPECKPKGYVLC